MTFSASLLYNIMFTTLVRVATHVRFTTLVRVTHLNPSFPPVPLFCELLIYIYFVQCAERVGYVGADIHLMFQLLKKRSTV